MKIKISFMTMFFSLSFLFFLLSATSCNPDYSPCTDPGKCKELSASNTVKAVRTLDDYPDFKEEDFTELDPDLSFDQAKKAVDFYAHPDWGVDIKAFICTRQGQSLVVHNPNKPDLDYYTSPTFAIYWFKDGKPIRGRRSNRIECVCKGEFAAIVLHKPTKRGVGIAFKRGIACLVENQTTVSDDDDQ